MIDNKYLSIIEKNSQQIIDKWIGSKEVLGVLEAREVNTNIFKNHFAARILGYLVAVAKDEAKAGQCPTISIMLQFFSRKHFQLDEIFRICDKLKENIVLELYEHTLLDKQSINELFLMFSLNFSGVIREFIDKTQTNHSKRCEDANCPLIDNPSYGKNEEPDDIKILSFDDFDTELNQSFCDNEELEDSILDFDDNDIEIIDEVYEEIEQYIISLGQCKICRKETEHFIWQIEKLSGRLEILGFKKISKVFSSLGITLSEQLEIFEKITELILFLFEAMLNDLAVWKETILKNETTKHIENSMCANIEQIQAIIIWEAKKRK